MPRHRREHVPRHRAQRTADHPARRALVTAAVPAPRTGPDATGLVGIGLAGTGPDDAETAPLAMPAGTLQPSFEAEISRLARLAVTGDGEPHDGAADGAAVDNGAAVPSPPGHRPATHSRRRIQRAASAPASRPPGRQQGVARGVLMTPWFAAASGFVIAASLWIYSSHPQLTFPIVTGSAPPCIPDGCSTHADPQGVPSLNINSGQPISPQHTSAKSAKKLTRGQGRSPVSGLSFRYFVHPAADGNFDLIVIVTGKRSIKDWRLAFVLAGDRIQNVFGADWKGAGTDRVAARPLTGDQGPQFGASGNDGGNPNGQGGYGRGGGLDRPGVFFTVVASGTPAAPTQCTFDGVSCTFHELSSASEGGR